MASMTHILFGGGLTITIAALLIRRQLGKLEREQGA
jgi:hypothetical protein